MAFDGTYVAAIAAELKREIQGDRIAKIAQPEPYELILTFKGSCGQRRLLLSANPALPVVYFTSTNKPSPMNAPNFCMVLRKHISNGRVTAVYQPSLERIIIFEIEHLNELGDLCRKKLVCELMGKYSNIIFCDENDMIIDSLKHISSNMSGLREVLPGRTYFLPEELRKADTLAVGKEDFYLLIYKKPTSLSKAMCSSLAGMSMVMAGELCFRAGIDSDAATASVSDDKKQRLWEVFSAYTEDLKAQRFAPVAVYEKDEATPVEFSAMALTCYADLFTREFDSASELLETFYSEKNLATNMRSKSADLRRIIANLTERTSKKLDIQMRQYRDTEKRDDWRIRGELILANQYAIAPGQSFLEAENYYTGERIRITLDPTLTAVENANRLFAKYQKAKRTREALIEQIEQSRQTLEHLESIEVFLAASRNEDDLSQIKDEMTEAGFIRGRGGKKRPAKGKPLHFVSSDGFDMYVGKNNFQNEEVTFKLATGNDWWFHAKKLPGSHVIVKADNRELPDSTFNEAARLAAFFSKGAEAGKVEVDYVRKKEVKKAAQGPRGFVIYHTNYSMVAEARIDGIRECK